MKDLAPRYSNLGTVYTWVGAPAELDWQVLVLQVVLNVTHLVVRDSDPLLADLCALLDSGAVTKCLFFRFCILCKNVFNL